MVVMKRGGGGGENKGQARFQGACGMGGDKGLDLEQFDGGGVFVVAAVMVVGGWPATRVERRGSEMLMMIRK